MSKRKARLPSVSVYRHGRSWRAKFRIAGQLRQVNLGRIEEIEETDARAKAESLVKDEFGQSQRRRKRQGSRNSFEAYIASKRGTSDSNRANVIRFA